MNDIDTQDALDYSFDNNSKLLYKKLNYEKILKKFNKKHGSSFWTNIRDGEQVIYLTVKNGSDTKCLIIKLGDEVLSSKKLIRNNLLKLLSNLKGEGYIPLDVDFSTPLGWSKINMKGLRK